MGAVGDVYDLRGLRDAVRLAMVVARPFVVVDPERASVAPLDAETSRRIAAADDFRAPMNRALARRLGLTGIPLGQAHLTRLARLASSRLALTLVTADPEQVRRAALILMAAILHKRIVKVVLKSERARLEALLGTEGIALATREAPVLHAPLADLDAGPDSGLDLQVLLGGDRPVEAARGLLERTGLAAWRLFLRRVEPDLVAVYDLRWPAEAAIASAESLLGTVGEPQAEHMVRLMQRRMEPWRTSIA